MSLVMELPTAPATPATTGRTSSPRQITGVRTPRPYPSESSRALLGLLKLSQTAAREMTEGSANSTFEGVISRSVLRSLLGTLHLRHTATLLHSRRVALLAFGLANHLGWEGRQLRVLEVAGLLHDIGKIGVPDTVLEKPGRLSDQERELIALHNNVGFDILQACRVDRQVQEVIGQSQHAYSPELNDGRDCPSGKELHMGARILAVADAYDSLFSEQAHRRAKSHAEIMTILCEGSGSQFDANVVSALGRWVQNEGLPFVSQAADEEHEQAGCPIEMREADSVGQMFSYLHTLERVYDGFHLIDTEGKILIWNRRAEMLLGRPAETMLGQRWSADLFEYRHLDERELHPAETPMIRSIEACKTALSQMIVRHASGKELKIELQAFPLFDDHGRLMGVAEFYRNLESATAKQTNDFHDLKLAATRDALTNVANRRELETQLTAGVDEFTAGKRESFSVIFADADHFKRINDTYGHGVGDQVLIEFAKMLKYEVYSGELVGRYGGEEFVVLCPDTNLEQAVRRAERFRNTLRQLKINGFDRLNVTASFGVASAEEGDTVDSLLQRADKALYRAKEEGRDRTCSLTNAELLGPANAEAEQAKEAEPFVHRDRFNTVIASGTIYYKLCGFVNEHKATLTTVSSERVVMRIGRKGLLASLNPFSNKQMVEIDLSISGLSRALANHEVTRMQFGITIVPIGRHRDSTAFQELAYDLVSDLKRFLVVE